MSNNIQRLYYNGNSLYLVKGKTFDSYRSAKRYATNIFSPNESIIEEPQALCEEMEDAEPVDETSNECKQAKRQVIGKHSDKIIEKIEKKQKAKGKVVKNKASGKAKDMVDELLSNQMGGGLKLY